MLPTAVCLIRCASYAAARIEPAIDEAIAALGGWGRFVRPGERVLLKPNCISGLEAARAAQTDPGVILAVARRVKALGATPLVGDSPAWGSLENNLARLGLIGPLKEVGCQVLPFTRPRRVANYPMRVFPHLKIAPEVLAADKVINLPKLKGHCQLGLTAAIKNLFGCMPGKRKAWYHFSLGDRRNLFAWMLVELFDRIRPILTIVDGVVGQEGNGPIKGTPRRFGWIVAGTDGPAIERVCAELVGLAPNELRFLRAAAELGIGQTDLDRIEVLGESIASQRISDFVRPDMIPIRFPLWRVVRSTARNLVLLHKERRSR